MSESRGGAGDAAVRAVVSDFGGVLTSPLVESFLAYQESSGITIEQLGTAMHRAGEAAGEHPLHALERGEISEAEFLRRLEEQLGEGVRLHGFRETFFDNLRPNERMIEYLRDLSERGLRLALLTNNVREWEPHWRAKLPELEELFELVVDSAFVGMRKPEPRIYQHTLERLGAGLGFEDCVFIDDNHENAEAAEELGMRAVHFRDTEQAIAEIEELLG